ncbi:MAG: hypothetical protein LBH12_03240 [Dysgonamonadaceae bacterium]|jgi:hypothetical protein|nr:hypothetical protein [Dysgonamonadaceae bacterium]
MKIKNENLHTVFKSVIIEVLDNYEASQPGDTLSDLFIRFNEETGILTLFDDMGKNIFSVDLNEKDVSFQNDSKREFIYSAKEILNALEKEGVFNKEYIYKPFTVNLVDENLVIQEELIFIDDNTLPLNNDILETLDKELDDFFNRLMN